MLKIVCYSQPSLPAHYRSYSRVVRTLTIAQTYTGQDSIPDASAKAEAAPTTGKGA